MSHTDGDAADVIAIKHFPQNTVTYSTFISNLVPAKLPLLSTATS